ncbi:hypothetical protein [Paludisphaera soli]|uniref:hypothetical protein n=1 Tax=Paludisphaera soli TaxID=2712865 RepID=UPI0013EB5C45|nr:hypothetical protein [Paludisphaera soli]
MTHTTTAAKFHPGRIVATPGALEAIRASGQNPETFLAAHLDGYWGGDLCDEDRLLNDEALSDGSRILSAYRTLRGERIWVITEAVGDDGRRASTTLLLASEY